MAAILVLSTRLLGEFTFIASVTQDLLTSFSGTKDPVVCKHRARFWGAL